MIKFAELSFCLLACVLLKKRLTASQALASTWIVNSNVNHLSENKLLDTKFIARVKDCLEKFSVATSIKKLGLIYIAHRSSTRKVCQLKQLYSNLFENQSRSIMANLGYSKETFHKIFSSDVSLLVSKSSLT